MSVRNDFALYLESAGPGSRPAELRRSIGPERTQSLKDRFSAVILIGQTARELVLRSFGEPDQRTAETLNYRLPGRPEYLYCFEFDAASDLLVDHGYRREVPLRLSNELRRAPDFAEKLAALGATTNDVRCIFGEPAARSGWWPIETWEYDDQRHIVFRHGLAQSDCEQSATM